MASKSGKDKKSLENPKSEAEESVKKPSPKSKKTEEDEDDDIDDDGEVDAATIKKGKPTTSKKKSDDDEEEEEPEEVVDDWEKVEEEENWDPDFEEFDIPKSKAKKGPAGKKAGEEEDDFKIDEEFKDMDLFNESSFDDEEDDF